ncbi:hypothetical protein HDU99_002025, partial [Rhizoclosmatium hyalinum]
ASETGKSTIFKQLKFLYGEDPSIEELHQYRTQILENASQCVKDLTRAMDLLQIPYDWDPLFPLSSATLVSSDLVGSSKSDFSPTPDGIYSCSGGSYDNLNIPNSAASDEKDTTIDRSISILSRQKSLSYPPSPSEQNHSIKKTMQITDPLAEFAALQYLRVGGRNGQQGNGPYAAKFLEMVDVKLDYGYGKVIPFMVLDAVKTVWHDDGVQYCFTRGSEFHLMDCCQ